MSATSFVARRAKGLTLARGDAGIRGDLLAQPPDDLVTRKGPQVPGNNVRLALGAGPV